MKIIVGVGDMKVSNNTETVFVTYALGSCLGVTIYDPIAQVGGLLHTMLPLSKADPEKAKRKPEMYVDTGFAQLLHACYDLGARKKDLVISVAGGANMKQGEGEDFFKIGKRNFTILRKLLWKNRFMIESQDVGGKKPRTMSLRMLDGVVSVNRLPISKNGFSALPVNTPLQTVVTTSR